MAPRADLRKQFYHISMPGHRGVTSIEAEEASLFRSLRIIIGAGSVESPAAAAGDDQRHYQKAQARAFTQARLKSRSLYYPPLSVLARLKNRSKASQVLVSEFDD